MQPLFHLRAVSMRRPNLHDTSWPMLFDPLSISHGLASGTSPYSNHKRHHKHRDTHREPQAEACREIPP